MRRPKLRFGGDPVKVTLSDHGNTVEYPGRQLAGNHAALMRDVEPFADEAEMLAHLNDLHRATDEDYNQWCLARAAKFYQQNNNQAAPVNEDEAVSKVAVGDRSNNKE